MLGLNSDGQVGDGTSSTHSTPVAVIGFSEVVPELVPGLSPWGLTVLALTLAAAAYISVRRRALRQTS